MKKILLIAFFIIVIIGILGYNYLYQDHRDVATSDATSSYTSTELITLLQIKTLVMMP
jgi:predicted negative regulator of RcsB-dependent stress response